MGYQTNTLAVGLLAALTTLSCAGAATPAPGAQGFPVAAFAGTVPTASGPGIDLIIDLFPDGTWASTETYVDRREGPFIDGGTIEVAGMGEGLLLRSGEDPRFRVKPERDTLRLLDGEGKRIFGPQEDLYVLDRITEAFGPGRPTGVEWLLFKLEGMNVSAPGPQVSLTLEPDSGWATGLGGCNRYRAQFAFQGMYGLVISDGISTRMTCPDLELETRYYSVLRRVRQYRLIDDRLFLYGERGRPLAEFRIEE